MEKYLKALLAVHDVFIELEECTPDLRQCISEIAWEVGFEMDRVITTVVTTRAELEQGPIYAPLALPHSGSHWPLD